jgi:hypothetical protein
MASSQPTSKTPARKKSWKGYKIGPKFKNWASPIVDTSYGNITAEDVLKHILEKGLANEILPLIESGRQPIGPFGPSDRYLTKDHKWESNTPEYQRLKRTIYGLPPERTKEEIEADQPKKITQFYKVEKYVPPPPD